MNWLKPALDVIVTGLNYFPGLKTKLGAVLQVLVTVAMAYNSWGAGLLGYTIPADIILAVQTAAATLVAVGAANQPANLPKPPVA